MRNKYPGYCYRCGEYVDAGKGHFERVRGHWRVQHADCAIKYRGTKVYGIGQRPNKRYFDIAYKRCADGIKRSRNIPANDETDAVSKLKERLRDSNIEVVKITETT
ncbi:hypothetical protein [Candidatus Enterococcus ferrettii]|uniref:Uncharacterized protein n=1 Tax=Candidatus Enterococcus ferrettii TaxID=2815324 RepID=A0ABV0EV67_9ENTE